MKLKTMLCTIVMFTVLTTGQAFAAPGIINLIIDGSGSVSEEDFTKAKAAAITFMDALYDRSQRRPGELCDWFSVNFFGDDNDYKGTKFVNCSNMRQILAVAQYTITTDHPNYQNTAIYTAIGKGMAEELEHEGNLGEGTNTYVKNIILVTDGKDNSSNSKLKQLVRAAFPNSRMNLILIAVGPKSDVREFSNVADIIIEIEDYDMLSRALIRALDQTT